MANIDLFLEAERRGLLPADKQALLEEARNRGLLPKIAETRPPGQIPGQMARPVQQAVKVDPLVALQNQRLGSVETPVAIATGMVGGAVGGLAGAAQGLFGGKYGTPEGANEAEQTAARVAAAMTYQPRTAEGRQTVETFGNALGAVAPAMMSVGPEINALARSAPSVVRMVGDANLSSLATIGQASTNALAKIRSNNPAMAGVGAAATEIAKQAQMRASALPYPMKLSKGEATGDFGQLQFERETAKRPEGAPLREATAVKNEQIIQNLDAFNELTRAEQTSLRGMGQTVDQAFFNKFERKRKQVEEKYTAANEAGDMRDPIPVETISKYINKNQSASTLAPILTAVKDEIKKLDPKNTKILSLYDIEQLRKMTGKLATPNTPNIGYGIEIKKMIDGLTENKGGELYQVARKANQNLKNEFKNTGIIRDILGKKVGTNDRRIAFEDMFHDIVIGGSRDDLYAVRKSLQNNGPEGLQAWKELQGATIRDLRDSVTSNSSRDIHKNPIVSFDKFKKKVDMLDADNKLELIFGNDGASQIRDLRSVAQDVLTSPPGSVNFSNTASAIAAGLDLGISAMTGLPAPAATLAMYGVKKLKSNALKKKVQGALDYNALAPKD